MEKITFSDAYTSQKLAVISDKRCLLFGLGINNTRGWDLFIGYGAIKQTLDGGQTWEQFVFDRQFREVQFFNAKNGYANGSFSGLAKITLK